MSQFVIVNRAIIMMLRVCSVFAFSLILNSCGENEAPPEVMEQVEPDYYAVLKTKFRDAGWRDPAIDALLDVNFPDFFREYSDQSTFHAVDLEEYLRLGRYDLVQTIVEAAPECAEAFLIDDDAKRLAQSIWNATDDSAEKAAILCSQMAMYLERDELNRIEQAFQRSPELISAALEDQNELQYWLPALIGLFTYPGSTRYGSEYDQLVTTILLEEMSTPQRIVVINMLQMHGAYLRKRFSNDPMFRDTAVQRWSFLWNRFESIEQPPIFDLILDATESSSVDELLLEAIALESLSACAEDGSNGNKQTPCDPTSSRTEAFFAFFSYPNIWDLSVHPRRGEIFERTRINGSAEGKPGIGTITSVLYGNESYLSVLPISPGGASQNGRSKVEALAPISRDRAIEFFLSDDPAMHAALSIFRTDQNFLNYVSRRDFIDPRMVRCIPVNALQRITIKDGDPQIEDALNYLNQNANRPIDALRELCFKNKASWVDYLPGSSVVATYHRYSLGLEPSFADVAFASLDAVGTAAAVLFAIPSGGSSLGIKAILVGGAKGTMVSTSKVVAPKLAVSQSFKHVTLKQFAAHRHLRMVTKNGAIAMHENALLVSANSIAKVKAREFLRNAGIRVMTDARGANWLIGFGDRLAYQVAQDVTINVSLSGGLHALDEIGVSRFFTEALDAVGQTENIYRRIRIMRQYGITPKTSKSQSTTTELQ